MQLNVALAREISNFINENKEYINSFDKVVIYYDNGQETLATILDTLFVSYPNVERRIDFDHKKKRLFQVSDMLTVIDKLDYKRKIIFRLLKQKNISLMVKTLGILLTY